MLSLDYLSISFLICMADLFRPMLIFFLSRRFTLIEEVG